MFKITNILFKKNNNFNKSSHYRWNNNTLNFEAISKINVIPLFLLTGIEDQRNRILTNTELAIAEAILLCMCIYLLFR